MKLKLKFLSFFLIVSLQIGTACSCLGYSLSINHINATELIFKGEAISVETVAVKGEMLKDKYTFIVDTLIKGDINGDTISIFTNHSSAACGASFAIGIEYYVFSNRKNDRFNTDVCSYNGVVGRQSFLDNLISKYQDENSTKWYNSQGALVAEGSIVNGLPDGYWIIRNDKEELMEKGTYKSGLKHGKWMGYRNIKAQHMPYSSIIISHYDMGELVKRERESRL